jgi:hypothetical protein
MSSAASSYNNGGSRSHLPSVSRINFQISLHKDFPEGETTHTTLALKGARTFSHTALLLCIVVFLSSADWNPTIWSVVHTPYRVSVYEKEDKKMRIKKECSI